MIVGIIPARFASVRLPGKPLVDLCGQTMVERVWRAAIACQELDKVVIATDDMRVVAEAQRIGAEVCLTAPELPSGTDRCDEVVRQLGRRVDVAINIQGDEPLLDPGVLTNLITTLATTGADVTTPITRITDAAELFEPSVVKVVRGADGQAIYFSRSAVPYVRDTADIPFVEHWKHIGIYAFTREALRRHVNLPPSPLEFAEKLEQLRLLEAGARFGCVETHHRFVSVDTWEDAERVRSILAHRQ